MKTCTHCKIEKDKSFFGIRNDIKGGYSNTCKACRSSMDKLAIKLMPQKRKARSLRAYLNNKEKIDAYTQKWRLENKEKVNHYYATNYIRNARKINACSVAIAKRHRDLIDETYAKSVIALEIRKLGFNGVSVNNIPKELVAVKIEHLKIKRKIKELSV